MTEHRNESIGPRDLELVELGGFHCQRYAAGSLVELDASELSLAYVRRGRVLVTTVDEQGRETLCMLRRAGALIGIESLQGYFVPYQIWMLGEVELCTAGHQLLSAWLGQQEHAAATLAAKAIASASNCLTERMAMTAPTATRLGRFLLSAAELDPSARGQHAQVALPRNVLARVLGMRPETLSRALRKLERAGAIQLEPDLRVVDLAALRRIIKDDRE